jgi:YfiH family protein
MVARRWTAPPEEPAVPVLSLGGLNDADGLRHGFFTRRGGASGGLYGSLNCGLGSGDDPEAVRENRARCARRLGAAADRLVTGHQVHGTDVAHVTDPWEPGRGPKVDAMVTDRPGIVLGILTADCVPVLFADPAAGVIGAAHAGWKGAKNGVVARTVDAMTGLGARRERIVAAVGPHIGFRSYEVGPEFPARFLAEDPAHARLFRPAGRAGHHLFDLGGYVDHCLARAGVGAVHHGPWDTLAEADRFFSYRRAKLAGEPDYGRGLSAIVLG